MIENAFVVQTWIKSHNFTFISHQNAVVYALAMCVNCIPKLRGIQRLKKAPSECKVEGLTGDAAIAVIS